MKPSQEQIGAVAAAAAVEVMVVDVAAAVVVVVVTAVAAAVIATTIVSSVNHAGKTLITDDTDPIRVIRGYITFAPQA